MKILLVNYEYPPLGGGGGIAMREIAEELSRRHEVHILTSLGPGLAATEKHPTLDLTVHRVKVFGRSARATASFLSMASFLPFGARLGNRFLAENAFDVVNTWFAIPSGCVGAAITRWRDVPHVLTVCGGDIYDPSKWYSPHRFAPAGAAVRWAIRHAEYHVAISTDISRRAHQYYGFDGEIEVIPLGIKEPQYRPSPRAVVGMSVERKYIVAVGRLLRRKDYPNLLKALKGLGRTDVSLLLLGDGPEKETLQALSLELGVADQVEFRGFVSEEEKLQILSNADLFCLVSLHEGFGVVYLEAMYSGLPIVAANEGGQLDLLEDRRTGRLVPVGDHQELTDALRMLLEDQELSRRIGAYNRQRFGAFSISRLAARYEAAFEKVCAGVKTSLAEKLIEGQ